MNIDDCCDKRAPMNCGSGNPSKTLFALVGLVAASFGAMALGGIQGSKHDFSRKEWTGGDRCAACHATENVVPPRTIPLWNAGADITRRFGIAYDRRPRPGNGTLICVRCHDGSIARDTIAGILRDRFVSKFNPGLFSAGHGRSDHPVGVKYPQFDRGFRTITSVLAKGTVLLPDGRVECNSCHDPHNQSGNRFMLVRDNHRSALCLTCHRK